MKTIEYKELREKASQGPDIIRLADGSDFEIDNKYKRARINHEVKNFPALLEALDELMCIVKIHSQATSSSFAWAELNEAEKALKAAQTVEVA